MNLMTWRYGLTRRNQATPVPAVFSAAQFRQDQTRFLFVAWAALLVAFVGLYGR